MGLVPDPDLPRALPLLWTVVAIAIGGEADGEGACSLPCLHSPGMPVNPTPPGLLPRPQGGGSHGDSREEAVPGRTPEYDLQEQECEIRWCSLVVLHIENRSTSATIPNYRHSQRRRVLIFFHTIRGVASRETACPRYPHVLPHPPGR